MRLPELRVDWRTSAALIGLVLKALSIPLAAMALVAVGYGEAVLPFVGPAALTLVVGAGMERLEGDDLGLREAYLMVATTWLAIAVVGALPFVIAGEGALATPVNALFESMSGITTTGATVVGDFDAHARSIHLWRATLQWIGGLGILVLAVAILSQISVGGAQLMETESQAETVTKLTPRIERTARLLGTLYLGLTAAMVVSLLALRALGLAPEVGLYDAVAHAFTAISTAGFSPRPESLGAFSPAVQWVTILFMVVGATNFILLYYLVQGDPDRLRESEEFRFYLGILAVLAALTATFLVLNGRFGGVEPVVRHALFQVVSIVTTTGYATVDFDLWSPAAKHILFVGMFVGGMAGSTTCSIKTVRWLVVTKSFSRDLFTEIHPESIRPIRLSGQVVDEETVRDIYGYVLLTLVIFALFTVFIVVDSTRLATEVGEFEALGAAAATFLNIGPAFGAAGPYGSYAHFTDTTKVAMIVLMWVGRIEIIPVLVLLTPAFWTS